MTRDGSEYHPTFAATLRERMAAWCDTVGRHPTMWTNWTDGIYSDYRELAKKVALADSVKLHKQANHILSSQTFAFNLFLPFREGRRTRLSECVSEMIGVRLTIDKVRFEWVPPGELLSELDGEFPVGDEPATGVDVVLWGRLDNRRRAVVLVEVKLSEGGFTRCNGRSSPGNRRKDVCDSADLFFNNPSTCYLRRPLRKNRDRRYWDIFATSYGSVRDAFPHADLSGPCPFAYDMQQPMRNLAIARALEQEDTVEQAWFALCQHDSNPDIAQRWDEWRRLLPDVGMAPSLPASKMVSVGEDEGLMDWATYMRDRYQLRPS